MRQVSFRPTFADWQRAARSALQAGIAPEEVVWQELTGEQPALDIFEEAEPVSETTRFRVPKAFVELARVVALHRDERRWALLYRLVWRLTHGEPKLLEISVDPDTALAFEFQKAIRRDVHKMRAFVRFREMELEGGEKWFVAWFEPAHHIVEFNAGFFVDRFASMRWSILTPERCAHWDGRELTFTEGVDRSQAPTDDKIEGLWLTYYANIFNPGRVKVHAMQAEMPKKYWGNLPEAVLIPSLLQEAPRRVEAMVKKSERKTADAVEEWQPAPVPETASLEKLADAAKACTACHLYKRATQTVFGEGPKKATIMMLGEQPGDQEDLAGKPFIGPAGQLLDRALEEAGIDRSLVYVTNTVKHFKWEPRGKRRIHQKPNSREIAACRPWMEAELRAVKPAVLVCLGATAAQAILGSNFRVTKQRGEILESEFSAQTIATVHPSSLLRQPDEESRAREYALFLEDLRIIKAAAK